MKVGGIGVGFEKRYMEDGMKPGKVRREAKLVCRVRDGMVDGERTEAAMIELVGRPRGLNVAT